MQQALNFGNGIKDAEYETYGRVSRAIAVSVRLALPTKLAAEDGVAAKSKDSDVAFHYNPRQWRDFEWNPIIAVQAVPTARGEDSCAPWARWERGRSLPRVCSEAHRKRRARRKSRFASMCTST